MQSVEGRAGAGLGHLIAPPKAPRLHGGVSVVTVVDGRTVKVSKTARLSEARKAYMRRYYRKNRERLIAQNRAYVERNREKVAAAKQRRYLRDKTRAKMRSREWYDKNREMVKARERERYWQNRDKVLARLRANRDAINARRRALAAQKRAAMAVVKVSA